MTFNKTIWDALVYAWVNSDALDDIEEALVAALEQYASACDGNATCTGYMWKFEPNSNQHY
jgi:hypothetical protein